MDKISCNVIQDLLPLYIDEVASEDTCLLVTEHLDGCETCAGRYEQMKQKIATDILNEAVEAEKKALAQTKRRLQRRRIVTAVLSVIAGAVIITMIVAAMNLVKIPVPYEEDRFQIEVRELDGKDCMFLEYTGKMHAFETVETTNPDTGEAEQYLFLYNTAWSNLFGGDDRTKQELFLGTLDFPDQEQFELRYVVGDPAQFYEPWRNYRTLREDSVLLWSVLLWE